jgi:cytochrome c
MRPKGSIRTGEHAKGQRVTGRFGLPLAGLLAVSFCLRAVGASDGDIKLLLDANGCSNCHSRSEQIVGPAFEDVARKYRNTPDARDALASKVRLGGLGVWGQVAMPPNPSISDADLRKVLDWILSIAPAA